MSQNSEQQDQSGEFDESALAALVRPSMAPAAAKEKEPADDGKLDLRALVASQPPPPAEAEPAEAPKAEAKKSDANGEAKSAKKQNGAAGASTAAKKSDGAPAKASAPKRAEAEPVAVPAVEPARPASNNGLYIGLGVGAVACVAMFFVMRGGASTETEPTAAPPQHASASETPREQATAHAADPTPVAAVEPTAAEAPTAEAAEAAAVEPATAEGTTGAAEVTAVAAVEPEAAPEASDERRDRRAGSRERAPQSAQASETAVAATAGARADSASARGEAVRSDTATARTEAATARTEGSSTGSSGSRSELDSVLDQTLGGRPVRGGTATQTTTATATTTTTATARASSADLPETPSQVDVRRVLGGIMSRLRECAGEQVGMATATIMVRNDGSVASASVGGAPFGGTPQGSCMEGALRGAHFPAFRQSTFQIRYPISIR